MTFGKNYNLFNDLNHLERMVNSLSGYLNSNQLYGSIGGGFFTGGDAPNLTVGTILLRLRRIYALKDMLDAKRQATFERIQDQHTEIRANFPERYEGKMLQEAQSRLNAMDRFFEECTQDPAMCPRIYNPEAFRRTVVQELIMAMDIADLHSADLEQKRRQTDKRLRGYVRDNDFLWDEQLIEVYPKASFWWLWMRPLAP
jgi:hypothetical protein